MGLISNLRSKSGNPQKRLPSVSRGQAVWRDIFGSTDKEHDEKLERQGGISTGTNSSIANNNPALKRLIEAFRTRAPGGWTDDRYEQTLRHFTGIQYVAIHRICTHLEQAEFQVFRKDPNHQDGKIPVTEKDKEGYKLVKLLERPNVHDSFGDMCYRWGQQISLTGMALTWMIPNLLGTPMELYSIATAMAVPQPVQNPDFPQGFYRIQPLYPYGPFSSYPTPSSAVGAAVGAQWMMKCFYAHPLLQYEGYSPLTGLREHIDGVESIDRSRWYSMKRGINPSAVLNFDDFEDAQPLTDEEIDRIRAQFEADHQGTTNAGHLLVAQPGSKLEPWGANPIDMDYQAGWDQLTAFVLGGFGITKPAAGMVEDSSYSTLFATLKQLDFTTVGPLCNKFARQCTRQLAPFFGDDLIVEIRPKPINDHDIQLAKASMLAQNKAITYNQLLKMLDMETTKEEWGEGRVGMDQGQEQQGMGGGGKIPDLSANPLEAKKPEETKAEPNEVANERPKAGKLSEGSKNPQKRLQSRLYKMLQNRSKNFNGNGVHRNGEH
jgi:phage portal protein BeeE